MYICVYVSIPCIYICGYMYVFHFYLELKNDDTILLLTHNKD